MCVFCVWLCDLVLLCVTGWHITCCLTVYQAAWSSIGVVVCLDCVNNALFFFFLVLASVPHLALNLAALHSLCSSTSVSQNHFWHVLFLCSHCILCLLNSVHSRWRLIICMHSTKSKFEERNRTVSQRNSNQEYLA